MLVGGLLPGNSPAEVMGPAVLVLGTQYAVETEGVEARLAAGRRIGCVAMRRAVDVATWAEEEAAARYALHVVIDQLEGTKTTIAPDSAVAFTRRAGGR